MKIVVIGAGYVGLVTGTCFAELGNSVTCVDSNKDKVDLLNNGTIPIHEPELESLLLANVAAHRIKFTDDPSAIKDAEIVLLAVDTPDRGDGKADITSIKRALDDVVMYLSTEHHTTIMTKSTVPVGTAQLILNSLNWHCPHSLFSVASNPEFLREGHAVKDFMHPDRIVVGVNDGLAMETIRKLYRPMHCDIFFMDFSSAELTKYASNCYLAMRLAYINELTNLCEASGADIGSVTIAMGADSRIGEQYLQPGPGFGGSCFPKDTAAMSDAAISFRSPMPVVDAVIRSNDDRQRSIATRISSLLHGIEGKRIAILGLAFKANTDDTRNSAASILIPQLIFGGAKVTVYDPVCQNKWTDCQCSSAYDACLLADLVVILTEWDEFKELDLNRLATVMSSPLMLDYRNLFKLEDVLQTPFRYHSLGRHSVP